MNDRLNADFNHDLFEAPHTPWALFNRNMIFIDISEKGLKILNIRRDEVVGKKLIEVSPFIESTEPFMAYMDVLGTGVPMNCEVKLNVNSKHYYFIVEVYRVDQGLVMMATDITDIMSMIKELQKSSTRFNALPGNLKNGTVILDEMAFIAIEELKAHLAYVNNILEKLN